ncbi:hypothetical protein F9C07_13396 [Aspergillus flavus]|uniref:Uncharacterized protein n=3 Tax=Aspergillus subgen. Circumdati TaxID=2720871 RepID=B8NYW6_ASPFN|nr:uncharacterized protein G4B84_011160 [Aspergillus flavus NRRL3357]KAB8245870.1 hypothetical protein BDV35DRAFT_393452 [Aspergillus flavus]KOC09245.1 hypothetical protein AFLA70_508g000650 [Aspergillus flavus AF70]OOO03833.1 hypothetical protein OAory_01022440 [Aspergillus oryzae]KAF7627006.1 hypothetical protein AFLA_012948 [Aspergillus flavus NRRL3357]KAJ1706773.1 DUF1774-domain-containing protein [Aspergillus flavus]
MASYNPFSRQESHGSYSLGSYRLLVPLSWLLVVVVGIYYTIHAPADVKHGHGIFNQANHHITPFSQSTTVTGIYWILLLLSQLSYVYHLFHKDASIVTATANVGAHFILNNLFIFAWILLWTRGHFWGSEIILIAHLINQHTAYWRHRALPPLVHLSAIAGPFAWTLMALFWNGAVAVHSSSLPARIVANIFIWVIFLIGTTHITVRQDDLLGYCLSFLFLGLALKQIAVKTIALQWIFAFVIFAVFLAESLYITGTKYTGRDVLLRRLTHPETADREREPLLNEQSGAAA